MKDTLDTKEPSEFNFEGGEWSIPSDISLIGRATTAYEQWLTDAGVEPGLAPVCFTEAITNAMKHGNQKDPDKLVRVFLKDAGQYLETRVVDQSGAPFDFDAVEDPTADEEHKMKTEGRGIYIMRKALGEKNVEFRYNEEFGGNEVVLRVEKDGTGE